MPSELKLAYNAEKLTYQELVLVMIADQPYLSNEQLRALLAPYRAQYDTDYDKKLLDLNHRHCFSRDDLDKVADWKFGSWPSRLQRTRDLLAANSDRDIESLTSRDTAKS